MSSILLIDDDAGIRKLFTAILRHAGHDVRAVENGREGLRALSEWSPDVVITDIVMPETDGLEMVRAIRRDHPDVRIIAMSGGGIMSGVSYLEMAALLGAHRVLDKPFGASDLLAAVDELAPCGAVERQAVP